MELPANPAVTKVVSESAQGWGLKLKWFGHDEDAARTEQSVSPAIEFRFCLDGIVMQEKAGDSSVECAWFKVGRQQRLQTNWNARFPEEVFFEQCDRSIEITVRVLIRKLPLKLEVHGRTKVDRDNAEIVKALQQPERLSASPGCDVEQIEGTV